MYNTNTLKKAPATKSHHRPIQLEQIRIPTSKKSLLEILRYLHLKFHSSEPSCDQTPENIKRLI